MPGEPYTISGTAGIAPVGKSIFEGDIVRQIHRSPDVLKASITPRIIRFRQPRDYVPISL
jgi:hypothetical protein